MRIAVISDLHANLQAWRALLHDLGTAGADSVVCLGDVVGYGPEPQAVLDKLRAVSDDLVMGNHEAAVAGRMDTSDFSDEARRLIDWTRERLDADSLKHLAGLPLMLEGVDVLYTHAETVEPGRFQYIEDAAAARANLACRSEPLVFVGHTHLPGVYVMDPLNGDTVHGTPQLLRVQGAVRYLVNVGSVGEPRDLDPRGSYAIYDDERNTVEFRRFEFDIAAYMANLAQRQLDYTPFFHASHRRRLLLASAGADDSPWTAEPLAARRAMTPARIVMPRDEPTVVTLRPRPGALTATSRVRRLPLGRRFVEFALIGVFVVAVAAVIREFMPYEDADDVAGETATPPVVEPLAPGLRSEAWRSSRGAAEPRTSLASSFRLSFLSPTASPAVAVGISNTASAPVTAAATNTPAPAVAVTDAAATSTPPAAATGGSVTQGEARADGGPERPAGTMASGSGDEFAPAGSFRIDEATPAPGPAAMLDAPAESGPDRPVAMLLPPAAPGVPTLSRPPSYRLAKSQAARMATVPGAVRPAAPLVAQAGVGTSAADLALEEPAKAPTPPAGVPGAMWFVCFGRGERFAAPGGVVWNQMTAPRLPAPAERHEWRDSAGRRGITATVSAEGGPIDTFRGGVTGQRLTMFGVAVPDEATDGAWAADGQAGALRIRLAGLNPQAEYVVEAALFGNSATAGRVEGWSVEGMSGPGGYHLSGPVEGPDRSVPVQPAADGTMTLTFRFGAGPGISGINALGLQEFVRP